MFNKRVSAVAGLPGFLPDNQKIVNQRFLLNVAFFISDISQTATQTFLEQTVTADLNDIQKVRFLTARVT